MATCLVIGGGLLGGAVARALADRHHDVVVFSRSLDTAVDLGHGSASPIRTVAGSIAPGRELAGLIDWSDTVFYFAGGSTPAGADADPGGSVQLAVVPATIVLELMRETTTRRLVLASSGGTVYGEPSLHPTPEDHPTTPTGIHGYNALTLERYAAFFALTYGLEPVILRIATAYGPGQRTRRGQGVIAAWMEAAFNRQPVHVYGSIETRRDFVFAADVADAAARAASDLKPGTYNVGSGTSHSLAELHGLLGELAGRELDIKQDNARGVDARHTELDCSKIAAEIGWAPTTELAAGLQLSWKWSAAQREVASGVSA